jgi:secreted PhoX family phosphatase
MRTHRFLVIVAVVLAIAAAIPAASQAQDNPLLLPLDDPMAPFLESRAYAIAQGATGEFRKMEWVAFDPAASKLYLAMSEVNKTMSDGEGAIQLEENNCGIVYEADVDDSYNISALKPLLVGGPYDETQENACDVNNIANPDSLFVDTTGHLWIGEDTSKHVNNMIWRWDGEKLERFATMPLGAEATGVLFTDAGDMFFSVQHPSAMNTYPFNRGTVVAMGKFNAKDDFTPVDVPEGDAQRTLVVPKGVTVQVIQRAGELIVNDIMGQRFGQVDRLDGETQLMCNQPDGNVFLPTNATATEGYLYTNYECTPGAVGKVYMKKFSNGWRVLEGENVDFDSVNGTWNNCGSSRTPWNTVLTAEEYEPPASTDGWQDNVRPMTTFVGEQANPYDYGYLVEIAPDDGGDSINSLVAKRYAMGRYSHEVAFVMPDGKTVYNGDDGTGVVLFKFVADEEGDLSAGTLYAAKVTQQDDGSLALEWIELGSGNDDEIAEALADMTLP